jgi:hypothetical protein
VIKGKEKLSKNFASTGPPQFQNNFLHHISNTIFMFNFGYKKYRKNSTFLASTGVRHKFFSNSVITLQKMAKTIPICLKLRLVSEIWPFTTYHEEGEGE